MRKAANFAPTQFGPDAQQSINRVLDIGNYLEDVQHIDHNWIAMNIEGVDNAVREDASAGIK